MRISCSRFIAFQLSNPFDEPITLNSETTAGGSFEYYIEYNDRFYPVFDLGNPASGQQGVGPVAIPARSHRTFYAWSFRDPTTVLGRIRAVLDAGDAVAAVHG